ncbi:MAG TPA: pilus assembly protein PilN, partial [Alcanivorax sp.]|nr:pilus assembly protein PilN [Alcanivorax sp.]
GEYTIEGVAESNNRISRLMRNFDKSAWFRQAALQSVVAQENQSGANSFVLTVLQDTPNSKNEEEKQ